MGIHSSRKEVAGGISRSGHRSAINGAWDGVKNRQSVYRLPNPPAIVAILNPPRFESIQYFTGKPQGSMVSRAKPVLGRTCASESLSLDAHQ